METDYHFFQFLFHNKKKYIFITLFFFINIALHAYSKQINSLSLSFIRSEYSIFSQNQNFENYLTSDNHSEINSITGKITYIKNPFLFIFETTSPVQQIVYINETAAYLLDDDTIYEIPDNYNDIYQTCSDFLAWFTDDYNLGKANFVISEPPVLSDNQLLTTWIYSKNEPHPIDKVYSYSNSKKQITKLQMFVDSSTLITQTDFKKYDYFCGYSFPIEIETTSFDNQQIIAQSKLTFSNISFNSLEKSDFTNTNIHLFIEQNDISKEKQITPLNIPKSNIYTVSIPSVLVTKGYSLYKKFITNQDMTNCPFYPSCSQYMLQAISKNGVFGFIQGLERLKRCTSSEHKRDIYPLTENGKHYDPVP